MSLARRRKSFMLKRSISKNSCIGNARLSESNIAIHTEQAPMKCRSVSPFGTSFDTNSKFQLEKFLKKNSNMPMKSLPLVNSLINKIKGDSVKQSREIELRLKALLKGILPPYSIDKDLKVYSKIFEEIIKKNKLFSPVLQSIYDKYQVKITKTLKSKHYENHHKLKAQIDELKSEKQHLRDIGKNLLKSFTKVSTKNTKLSRILQGREGKYHELHNQLLAVQKIISLKEPVDDKSWKYMLTYNRIHEIKMKQLKKKGRKLVKNQIDLNNLINAIQSRGFSVDISSDNDRNDQSDVSEESSNHYFVEGPPKNVLKPSVIPNLPLGEEGNGYSLFEISSDDTP